MPPEPIVMDPVPDPPALDSRLELDAETSSEEADASAEDERL
jgi:hypothetical protein